jgi:hypothetical protein
MKINLIILFVILVGCNVSSRQFQNKKYISYDYYFIAQLKEINDEVISFETIEIYCQNPKIEIVIEDNGNIIAEIVKFKRDEFTMGYLPKEKIKQLKMNNSIIIIAISYDDIINNKMIFDLVNIKNIPELNGFQRVGY